MLKFKTVNFVFALALIILLLYTGIGHVPTRVYGILVVVYLAFLAYGSSILSAQFFVPVRYKGSDESNSIALTFDDGPIAGNTEKILNILDAHKVQAAFFCIGNRVRSNPELTKRIHDAGHLIGNHSYWHKPTFDLQTPSAIHDELIQTDQIIKNTIGVKPTFFRPPYGVTNPMLASAIRKGGYKTIGWSVRSFDTVIKDSRLLMRRITWSLKGGDVILLHDYSQTTLEILPALLDHIEKVGLKIVRVDQLLNEKAYG